MADDTSSSMLPAWMRILEREAAKQTWRVLFSSNLSAFRYDPDQLVLSIRFKNGREYQYFDVDQDTADGLEAAASPGSYFWSNIRDQYVTMEG